MGAPSRVASGALLAFFVDTLWAGADYPTPPPAKKAHGLLSVPWVAPEAGLLAEAENFVHSCDSPRPAGGTTVYASGLWKCSNHVVEGGSSNVESKEAGGGDGGRAGADGPVEIDGAGSYGSLCKLSASAAVVGHK